MSKFSSIVVGRLYSSKTLTLKCVALVFSLPAFLKQYTTLKKTQYNSIDDHKSAQLKSLKELLTHSYQNVEYYHNLFDSVEFNPDSLSSLEGLEKIPFLTKDIIRTNTEALKAKNYPDSSFEKVTTSGSTGSPLAFYYETGVSRAREWAFIKILWERMGYHFTDKCVVLRGYSVSTPDASVFWKKSVFGRWLVLSPYSLNPSTYHSYFEKIDNFKPKYIQAFPSTISKLASYMVENKRSLSHQLSGILCSSEKLFDWQRETIEKAFHCRVFDFYGHSEQCVLAGGCEMSNEYHLFPEYGVVELIDNDGNSIRRPGVVGEIVATNLKNKVFPLIRYRTGDLGVYSENQICGCGRVYPRLISIYGRVQEFVYGKDMQQISTSAIFGADHSNAMSHIRQYQIVQNIPGKIIFNIVPTRDYAEDDDLELQTIFKTVLKDTLNVEIQKVSNITCGDNGKFKFVVQNVSEVK